MKIAPFLLAAAAALTFLPTPSQAEQYQSGGQVVHTNALPVVMHRLAPPFRGVHVYQGRTGRR